jgi:hypothetical protein
MIYLFNIDNQRRISVGQASRACVRSLACRGRVYLHVFLHVFLQGAAATVP